MSQRKGVKTGLAISVSLLIHLSLGLVFVVYWKTSNQFDSGRSQDVVIYLNATSTINQDTSPSPGKVKTIWQNPQRPIDIATSKPSSKLLALDSQSSNHNQTERKQTLANNNHLNENIIRSKIQPATKTVTSTNGVASQQQPIVTNPIYRKWKKPVYPRHSIAKNQQGKVLVDARIDEQGQVIDLKIHQSSGYPLLDRAAVQSIKQWIFEPVQHYGGNTEAMVRVPVNFVLAQR